jgi:hypothetical protein
VPTATKHRVHQHVQPDDGDQQTLHHGIGWKWKCAGTMIAPTRI